MPVALFFTAGRQHPGQPAGIERNGQVAMTTFMEAASWTRNLALFGGPWATYTSPAFTRS